MIETPVLNSYEIFSYPYDGRYLVYAPLAGAAVLCSQSDLKELERRAENDLWDASTSELLEKNFPVCDVLPLEKVDELTVLINQVCNFSCKYCYSARGRDKTIIDREVLLKGIDYFITPSRGDDVTITFSGGGDPMLSFPLLREAVEYAGRKAEKEGMNLHVGMVTNGSVLNDGIISFIKDNGVDVVISCDILRDVHDAQRSHYDIVASTIDRLCGSGINVGIRSTITPLNVDRMGEMVETLHRRFPRVYGAAFEAVLNASLFDSPEALRLFYDKFCDNIFSAIDSGHRLGVEIGNTVINNVGPCKTRACLGKLVLTPGGTFTACSRIASPSDMHYSDFAFGSIEKNEGIISIDMGKYRLVMDSAKNSNNRCLSCIARYHCSGGCLLAHKSLPLSYFDEYCRFQKEMVVRSLALELEQASDDIG